ncbi:MAG TPA: adenylate/guanylate cyclase domain-containing protein [Candidatus Limnocylindrales bacterium]|nr:adenylate/guanylate cyclase domain-containing protein [Candidatus Limnocylindrales bacterium]
MPRLQAKSFAQPDDVRAMPKVQIETINLDEATVGHCSFAPGWRWSTDLQPVIGTPSCVIRHFGYTISGNLRVEMDDGEALEIGPNTVFEIPPGHDKWVVGDEPWNVIEWGASGRAMAAAMHETAERTLATVMFTDIVDSTTTLERVGDAAWHDLLVAHNALLREELNVFRGREMKTTGDGFLAVFDSATRAVRCAAAMTRSTAAMALPIRIGLHTGEVEFVGGDVRGIAVHAAARVMALAGPNEVMVSSTTSGLLEGSDLVIVDAGLHELKGLSGLRQVFRLVAPPAS